MVMIDYSDARDVEKYVQNVFEYKVKRIVEELSELSEEMPFNPTDLIRWVDEYLSSEMPPDLNKMSQTKAIVAFIKAAIGEGKKLINIPHAYCTEWHVEALKRCEYSVTLDSDNVVIQLLF